MNRTTGDMLIMCGLGALTLFLFALGYIFHFHGGFTYEFCHYAEIASNILSGVGYRTRIFFPAELAFLEHTQVPFSATITAPVAFRFPFFAFWLAAVMRLVGSTDIAVALANGLLHALWVACIFEIGRRIFDRRVAFAAAFLWACQPVMLTGFDLSGHPDVLFGVLFLIHGYLFWRSLERVEFGPVALSGALGGLCFLTRQNFAFWLPVFLFLIAFLSPANKAARSAVYLLCFSAVSALWFTYYVRTFHRWGNPLLFHELADSTIVFRMPWMEYRSFGPEIFRATGFFTALIAKFRVYLTRSIVDLFTMWLMPLVFPLFLISLTRKSEPKLSFPRFMTLLLAVQVLIFSFLRHESFGLLNGRYFLWFAPIMLLGALAWIDSLSKRFALAIVGALALAYWTFAFRYLPSRHSGYPGGADIEAWEEINYLKENTRADEWIISNIPAQITWYAKRPSINIPNTLDDFKRIVDTYPVNRLFLSKHLAGERFNYPEWSAAFENGADAPPDLQRMNFTVEKSFVAGTLYKRVLPEKLTENLH